MKYHYVIRDAQNNIIHDSRKGIAKSGFDDFIQAGDDGNLIMNMKFPGQACYVHVFKEGSEPANNN